MFKKVLWVICSNQLCSLNTSNMALLPFKASCLALSCKLIDAVKVKLKYTYLFTTSGQFPLMTTFHTSQETTFLKTIILNFSVFLSAQALYTIYVHSQVVLGVHVVNTTGVPGHQWRAKWKAFLRLPRLLRFHGLETSVGLNVHPCLRPSPWNCFSKDVKPERFCLTASQNSSQMYTWDSCHPELSAEAQYFFSLLEGLELHKNGGTNSCSVYLHRLMHLHIPTNYVSYFGFTQIPCFPEHTRYPKKRGGCAI